LKILKCGIIYTNVSEEGAMNTTELINILDTLNDFIYNTEILKKDKKEK